MKQWINDLLEWLNPQPSHHVQIVCLANSRKYGGRCLAGLRLDGSGWIRPVGDAQGQALSPWQRQFSGGNEANLLDLLTLHLAGQCPQPHQPENWLLARLWYNPWHRPCRIVDGLVPVHEIVSFLTSQLTDGPTLFGNCDSRLDTASLDVSESIVLVAPDSVQWLIQITAAGNRRTRVCFRLSGAPYNLSLTDPSWEERLGHLPSGRHSAQAAGLTDESKVLFTISLGAPYARDGCCYKLVAGVIVLPR